MLKTVLLYVFIVLTSEIDLLCVAVVCSLESLPSGSPGSIPEDSGILIFMLGLGVCHLSVLCPVLSPMVALALC